MKNPPVRSKIETEQGETYATVYLKGARQRKVELNYGSTYLSQSSRTVLINDAVDSIRIFDNKGKLSRTIGQSQ